MARSVEVARAFISLESETKGLQAGLATAEKALGRTAKFVLDHPVAALGALGTAAIGVGLQAVQMAADVDTAVRRIGASIPEATTRFGDLKQVAKDLSTEFGVAQTDIVKSMEAIAKGGVGSVDELIAATKAVQLAVKATGEDTSTVVGLLDKTLDAFHLTAKDSEAVLAKLFITAQGKTSLSELAGVFERLAPLLGQAGIGFDTAASAAATLITQGKTSKQIVTELSDTLKLGGVPAIEALAAKSVVASDGLKEMRAQADLNNNSLGSLQDRLKQQLNAALTDLGERLLPLAVSGLQAFLALVDRFKDRGTSTAAEQVSALGEALVGVSATMAKAILPDFDAAFQRVTRSMVDWGKAIRKLGSEDLLAFANGLIAAEQSGQVSGRQLDRYRTVLTAVMDEIDRRHLPLLKAQAVAVAAAGGVLGTLTDLEAAHAAAVAAAIKAEQDAAAQEKILADRRQALAAITNVLKTEEAALLGDARRGLEALRLEMIKAGGSVEAVDALLKPLVTRLAGLEKVKIDDPIRKATAEAKKLLEAAKPVVLTADAAAEAFERVNTNVGDIIPPAEKVKTTTHDTVAEIAAVATGALGVATAFGLVDTKAQAVLQSVIGIATNLGKALGGDPAAIFGVIGSLTGILGAIFSGQSPEERARKTLIQKNIEVLQANNRLLAQSSPGFVLEGASKGLASLFANLPHAGRPGGQGRRDSILATEVAEALKPFGVTLRDLDQLFKDSGLEGSLRRADGTFDLTLLRQLFESLQKDFTVFGDTFEEQMKRVRIGLQIGLIDPADEFGEIIKGLGKIRGGGSSAITDALGGLDLSNPEIKKVGIKRLQDLVAHIEDLQPGQLGGLTVAEFLEVITHLIEILQSGKPITSVTPGGTKPKPPSSGTGDEPFTPRPDQPTIIPDPALVDGFGDLVAVGDVTNELLERIVANTSFLSPLKKPVIPVSLFGSGTASSVGAGTVNLTMGDIVLNLTAGEGQDGAAIGESVFRAVRDRLLAELTAQLKQARAAQGSPTLGTGPKIFGGSQ